MRRDLSKEDLYEGVKTLVDNDQPHIQLTQHKLFTLFSVAFQYLLYRSTKEPGAYIIRIENSALAEKLSRKAKDDTSRKFLNSLLLPRKLKYGKSMFFIDFFHVGSWNLTNEIPQSKLKGALIVKNTSSTPMSDLFSEDTESDEAQRQLLEQLPEHYYTTMLKEIVPQTITICTDPIDELSELRFPFIKDSEQTLKGVRIASDIVLE